MNIEPTSILALLSEQVVARIELEERVRELESKLATQVQGKTGEPGDS